MKILIIDDNQIIRENISLYLEGKGHTTHTASNGELAFDMIRRDHYDFLIVDRMMPVIDGLGLIRMLQARSISIPFLFLTALSKQTDKIEGLSLGADDYLVKPFDLEELGLRIENIARRKGVQILPKNELTHGSIRIHLDSKYVEKDGKRIELSPKEYHILEHLMQHMGQIASRDTLYEVVWGDSDVSEAVLETVNVHIAHLRRKLGSDIIRTVKLSGYVIDSANS